ncbi:MAG TPA: ethanolamine ammonia-lyase subunit EutB [Candidatus Angelobacter sp.]|jgi:ethanolamine ammonia-lyase large subunit
MHKSFQFRNLADLFAKANEEKSGDQLAGLAAQSEQERVAAKFALADVPLQEIVANPLIPPEQDDVTRLILDTHDQHNFSTIKSMTVGEFREFILSDETDEPTLKALHWAITPEIAAAVTKLMSNKDLVLAANKIRVVTRCRNTMGQRGVLGIRLQPNHPADDAAGILLSAFDGLLYGCGDAVIGVNPATESVESVSAILHALNRLIDVYKIPTQACCLAHISTQLKAMERGAPLDLLFQSVAGTQKANESFGITLSMLHEGRERVIEHHAKRKIPPLINTDDTDRKIGQAKSQEPYANCQLPHANCMYFETGQGSALSADAHHSIDQLTLEARAYGVARVFEPFLVNSVVGFIGPEYLYDERQIVRAGLEDHFMGKLLGLPMGCDVCYTNHAAADQNSADNLLMLLTAAGCNYFMGVPCSDDVMLNYQSTSFHDALAVRRLFNLRPAPEFAAWLHEMGIYKEGEPTRIESGARKQLAAGLEKAMK